jgi:dienelactone hydrolase
MLYSKSRIHFVPVVAVALTLFLTLAADLANAQVVIQVIPFDSITLPDHQVLLGETQGKPVTLAGELRLPGIPASTNKVPIVILVPGFGGLMPYHFEWVNSLNSWGIGVFIPDHLSGRGIAPGSPGEFTVLGLSRMVDIYQALPRLLKHPRIDPERMAIMGFSLGGLVTLLSNQERFSKRYGLPNVQFAAYIAVYPLCNYRFRDDVKVSTRPIRLFHGTSDDANPIEPCRVLVADLKKAGADATLTEYAGAVHGYDNPAWKVRWNPPQFVTVRKCSLIEGEGGQILNAQTGKPFAAGDPCIEFGASLQYDEAATASTRESVKGVLTSAFAAKPAAAAPLPGQGPKKTTVLPNGEMVWDLNGEWDLLWTGRGEFQAMGPVRDVIKVTQQGTTFGGVRMIGNPFVAKGTLAMEGELDKNGFKKFMFYAPNQEGSYQGKISNDGNLIEFDTNAGHVELKRK